MIKTFLSRLNVDGNVISILECQGEKLSNYLDVCMEGC